MIIVVSVFAVYMVARVLQEKDGPFNILSRLRTSIDETNNDFLVTLIGCFFCLSFWFSVPIAIYLAQDIFQFFIYAFGISGAVIVLDNQVEK